MIHISLTEKMRWAVNAFLIRHTPNRILNKFKEGRYLDYSDYCDGTARKKGYLSWRRTERLIERCLDCGLYIKSHQDLNAEPLSLTYLETYHLLRSKKNKSKDFYYAIKDGEIEKYENDSENWRNTLVLQLADKKTCLLRKPVTGYLCLETVCPTIAEMKRGILRISHLWEVDIFALSKVEDKILCYTSTGIGEKYPLDYFDYPSL